MAMEANPQLNLLDGLSSPMVSLDEQVRTEAVTALAELFYLFWKVSHDTTNALEEKINE